MNLKNLKKLNFKISHANYSLLFCGLMYLSCNILIIDQFVKWFLLKDKIDYIGLSAFFTLGFAVFIIFFLLISHPKTTKFFSIILCILSTISVYFIKKYDISIDRTMLMNTIYTDTSEVHSLLSKQMIIYFVFFTIIPTILILKTSIIFPKKYFFKSLKIILICLIICICF